MKENLDSIIFDLDGTLWDSTAAIAAAWQQAVKEADIKGISITRETVRGLAGMPFNAIYDKLFPDLKGEQRDKLQRRCAELEMEMLKERGGELYPEVKETLRLLKNKHKLAIVSNCQSGYIESFLQQHNLHEYFQDHECYGNNGISKGDNIREVIKRNSLKQAVYIGDTTGDYEASLKAQVPFILAAYGFGTVDADVTSIAKFSDLKNL
ncbi:HAD family hydrolase [Pontibacter cellulosilyticus]|uniref:phosphoglycolate phosphatase n=1 Tax=Pontibacter cellulosilyticus TaxID=1720253 RepID=A0A923SKM9_9BACT|nr:HAD family hydrolase [Pontibacter cellulosilyticus]MBC5995048.1 HAD family hydrolase [Pontibacter cellulosilyticus]